MQIAQVIMLIKAECTIGLLNCNKNLKRKKRKKFEQIIGQKTKR